MKKPDWIRIRVPASKKISSVKKLLQRNSCATVCEEAACPNLGECFGRGTAAFMVMGGVCTRNCGFCNVKNGKPKKLDQDEPRRLAQSVRTMGLSHVVITSVDRDDLRDGGASHFAKCVLAVRAKCPDIKIEILTPDFRANQNLALESLSKVKIDVFNHNIETVPRLYKATCPSADYKCSLELLKKHKELHPDILTKSGLMVGLGET